MLNCCMAGMHVPEIERYICTLKDCTRSAYSLLPFKNLPQVMLVHLLKNCTLWLNAFPAADGVFSVHSTCFLLTGGELSLLTSTLYLSLGHTSKLMRNIQTGWSLGPWGPSALGLREMLKGDTGSFP